jgi:hypothetical protein
MAPMGAAYSCARHHSQQPIRWQRSLGAYLTTLEGLTPKIEAIAVTDYYVTDTYEEFLKYKVAGRLPGIKLLFPNIELRLDVAAKSGFVNIHLLVSPEDPDHVNEVKRIHPPSQPIGSPDGGLSMS